MKKNTFFFTLTLTLTFSFAFSQSNPRLVVGIVVDQMRYDYIERYWNKFGEGGFKKLVNGGALFSNCNYNYVPTETAPGHASIYTGTTPSVHGIVANLWYDADARQNLSSVQEAGNPLRLSPGRLLVETVTDRFKETFKGSRVYSISIKDRGSILPGGKKADAAFWFEDATSRFISGNYYDTLNTKKKWIADFNKINYPKQFLKKGWILKQGHHFEYPDSSVHEGLIGKNKYPVFPYQFDSVAYGDVKYTSWGNKLTALFAGQALIHEKLGQKKAPDFLCISFSSTDYVGHRFGINSVEIEQTYLDLDSEIANLLMQFDKYVGNNNYLLFLTADHGAVPNPHYLESKGQAGGIILVEDLKKDLAAMAGDAPGKERLLLDCCEQIKFNSALIQSGNLNRDSLTAAFVDYLSMHQGIGEVVTASELSQGKFNYGIKQKLQNGFYPSRNGDILFTVKPNWIIWHTKTGTTHGTPYEYDTHVPLIFYGTGVKPGKQDVQVKITDIAPTVSALLGMEPPKGATGKAIRELIK